MITRQFLFVIAVFGLWTCVSCKPKFPVGGETKVDESAQEEPTDSLADDAMDEEEPEELVEDLEPVPNRKEAFSEFFFTFLSRHPFQANRVKFPLPVTTEDEEYVIRSGKHFREFFAWPSKSEYCMLVTREKEMEDFLNNVDMSEVDVQLIDLPTTRIRQFHFNRTENEWFVVSAKEYEAEGTLDEFLTFYEQFVTDSVYQQNHLAAQIDFAQGDMDEDEESISGTIEAYQWNNFRPELPGGPITNFLFGQDLENTDKIVLMHSSIADGMVESFKFKKQHGHWLLTGYNN